MLSCWISHYSRSHFGYFFTWFESLTWRWHGSLLWVPSIFCFFSSNVVPQRSVPISTSAALCNGLLAFGTFAIHDGRKLVIFDSTENWRTCSPVFAEHSTKMQRFESANACTKTTMLGQTRSTELHIFRNRPYFVGHKLCLNILY